nr:DarT ssDNA thymidine ADP-ribosyltransferase family protein [Phreatobacter stygius]
MRILRGGSLGARSCLTVGSFLDAAHTEVILTNSHAHRWVRLYFRPRTPTQYHIEGIRKDEECAGGVTAHAPMLVMFVFDAKSVLCRKGTHVSNMNMQRSEVTYDASDELLRSGIPFAKVYHDSSLGGDYSIIHHRCAEILAEHPLELDHLSWIYCRSTAERDTLLYSMGNSAAAKWVERVVVSDDLRVFLKEFPFTEEVTLQSDGLRFQFNPRRRGSGNIAVKIKVTDAKGNKTIEYEHGNVPPMPTPPSTKYFINQKIRPGLYRVTMNIDGHIAYDNIILVGDDLF